MKAFSVSSSSALLKGERGGAGPAIAFLHAGVADRRMWREQLRTFESTYEVAAYDRRGFGETTSPNEAFSNIEDLGTVLGYLELTTTTLVGCSQGAGV